MKAKLLIVLLLTLFISDVSAKSSLTLNDLRTEYLTALKDYLNAPKVYETFLSVEKPTAKMLAYQGALEAILTKTTWNIFKKISYLNKSEDSFNRALTLAPNDIEIRFMRLAVQYEIPEYLGFSDDMDTDKEFVVNNFQKFNCRGIPKTLIDQIIGFMYRSEKFETAQIETFKQIIATKKTTNYEK